MKVEQIRELFPILGTSVCGKPLVYFDNAATSQRPLSVVGMMNDLNLNHNANIHRAVHTLSADATKAYEDARDAVREYINSACRQEIVFTAGTTSAINLVAYSFGSLLSAGDEIIVGEAEHHSNLVPWQQLAKRTACTIKYLRLGSDCAYSVQSLESLITDKTKLLCFNHASNVLGIVNPVREFIDLAHRHGVKVLVDGAQGVVHSLIDVQEMDCDFYAFSAHKLFGPTGVGVLYGKKDILEAMPPFLCGGEMVGTVTLEETTFAALPMKFEAGTQNFINAAAFKPALELSRKILSDNELNKELDKIKEYLYAELLAIEGMHIFGMAGAAGQVPMDRKLPIFSFTIDGVHHEDLAILLDKMGVASRSGQMCAEPLMTKFGVSGMLRISLLQYNTMDEAVYFIKSLKRAVTMLK